jgi:hypothetical protein
MKQPKVFGIGFHKTGTTSLRDALTMLGYRVAPPCFSKAEDLGDDLPERAMKFAEDFDGFQDDPWPLLFRELDQRFPGSKFVLTVRDADGWYASVLRHFASRTTARRELIYGAGAGCPAGNEAIYKERYNRHNREVLDYFANRPGDLMVMDITKGHGWDELCAFLGHPVPDEPFPHKNPGLPTPVRRLRRHVRKLRHRLRVALDSMLGRRSATAADGNRVPRARYSLEDERA